MQSGIPTEDQSAATSIHSHTCWNTYLFKTTSNCTVSHIQNAYVDRPSSEIQQMPQWMSLPVLLFCCIKFSTSLLLHWILWFMLSPPPFNKAKFVQGGLRLQSRSLHSFSSHTVECFVLYFWICNLPFHWLAMNTMRIVPNPQSLMGSSSQSPNWKWSPLSDSCQKLQHSQRLPDPSSPRCPRYSDLETSSDLVQLFFLSPAVIYSPVKYRSIRTPFSSLSPPCKFLSLYPAPA